MKSCAFFVLSLSPVAALTTAENQAVLWLKSHQIPDDSQLADLAQSNPQAFAIVSGLLKKRHQNTLPESERGADVFRKMMGPRHLSAAAPETNVALPYNTPELAEAAPTIQNQMSYDLSGAGDKDEQMVDGLLSAVEGLAGGKGSKISLLRQKRHQQTQQVVDEVFTNPFGKSESKPVTPPQMSEEEKEQRIAAGLPVKPDTNALIAKRVEPSSVGAVVAVEQAEQTPRSEKEPEETNALSKWLR